MKLLYKLSLMLVITLLIAGFCFYEATGSKTVVALLNINSGKVLVDTGSGWKTAADEMKLGLNDKVKTENGKATIILYESIIISLDPDTEVTIADLDKDSLRIKQDSGSTWNKVTGLVGAEDYTVETPTTAAIVRGTFFNVGMDSVSVGEGSVEVKSGQDSMLLKGGESSVLKDGELVKVKIDDFDDTLDAMEHAIKEMKEQRQRELDKHPVITSSFLKLYDVSEDDIPVYMDKADNGEYNLEEVEKKSPVKMESVTKIKDMTEEIISQKETLRRLSAKEIGYK